MHIKEAFLSACKSSLSLMLSYEILVFFKTAIITLLVLAKAKFSNLSEI